MVAAMRKKENIDGSRLVVHLHVPAKIHAYRDCDPLIVSRCVEA